MFQNFQLKWSITVVIKIYFKIFANEISPRHELLLLRSAHLGEKKNEMIRRGEVQYTPHKLYIKILIHSGQLKWSGLFSTPSCSLGACRKR